jgi:acyl carrier protein
MGGERIVNDIDDFLTLIQDELGLPIGVEDLSRTLDAVPGWDSVHLLSLLTLLEHRTGRRVPVAGLLEAPSLERIYALVMSE